LGHYYDFDYFGRFVGRAIDLDFFPPTWQDSPMKKGRWKRFKTALFLFLVAASLWLLSSYGVAYWGTRRHRPPFPEPIPAIAWGKIESFRITTDDREELGAWFIDGAQDRPFVLLLQGNGGRRQDCLKQAEFLTKAGFPVMMISLRAHGDSTGQVNDLGYGARLDVIAAVRWLAEKYGGRPVVVWGSSLGAAAAIFAAKDLGHHVSGYILECPYQDLHTAVRNRTEIYLPPLLDRVAYLGLLTVSPLVLPNVDKISPIEASGDIPGDIPVLIMAGGADRLAHPEEANAIYRRIQPQADLVIFEEADHMKLFQTDPERYRHIVLDFLKKVE